MTEIIASTDDPEVLQDAERIVRCKYCDNWAEFSETSKRAGFGICVKLTDVGKDTVFTKYDGFCSWGERREE